VRLTSDNLEIVDQSEMRQRLTLLITLVVVVLLLIGLNAASYVRVEQVTDSEDAPDRSTLNSGATGTRALYDFLHEAGYQVTRWRDPTDSLLSFSGPKPATFVVIGRTIVPFSKRETTELLRWVESGGRLVLIDRMPERSLLPALGNWTITTDVIHYPGSELDPNDFAQMTMGVKPIGPAQPTTLARNVESVLPSRFAAAITIAMKDPGGGHTATPTPSPDEFEDEESNGPQNIAPSNEKTTGSVAPVVYFNDEHGALLVDYPRGKGRIVLLSDPFIVANNGIGRADNLLLAVNVIEGGGGLVAFDEFHQGHAATHNALIQYFSGTPVIALCAQLALIGLAIVWSRGRRFARPLPLPHIDRRSKLEFVASMAELQQRAKAHDLALENIYGRVRRVLVRYSGLSNVSPRAEIARRAAARSRLNPDELEALMRNCEDIINGTHTTAKESLRLVQRLREIESSLGLRTRLRDARQAAEKD